MHDLQVYWPRLKGSCQYSQCTAESWGRTWEQGYRCTIIMYKKTDVLNEGLDMVFWFFPLNVMADITARMKYWYFTKFFTAIDNGPFCRVGRTWHACTLSLIFSLSPDHHPGNFPVTHNHQPHLDPANGRFCEKLWDSILLPGTLQWIHPHQHHHCGGY